MWIIAIVIALFITFRATGGDPLGAIVNEMRETGEAATEAAEPQPLTTETPSFWSVLPDIGQIFSSGAPATNIAIGPEIGRSNARRGGGAQ